MRLPLTPGPLGVKYVSFAEPSGYGVSAKRCILALAHAGVPVTWTPLVGGAGAPHYRPFDGTRTGDPDLDPLYRRDIPYDIVIVHTVPEYFPPWVEAERGRIVIGHTVWETSALPAHWPALLNSVDRLWVPCGWNKTVFAAAGVTAPIDVVPHVAETVASSDAAASDRSTGDEFTFYTIGVWNRRKALGATVQAFCEAFTADDPVTLLIKTEPLDDTAGRLMRRFRGSVAHAMRRTTRRYARPPRIQLLTDLWTDDEIRGLHARGDCFVSLCRGEGWGLGAFDAAARGNPVVITGFGGQLDYLPADLAYLVDFQLVPVVHPEAPLSYASDQRWAEPDIQHGARLMREVFAHRDAARTRGLALQAQVAARFGEPAMIAHLTAALAEAHR